MESDHYHKTHSQVTGDSAFRSYQRVIVGESSLWFTVYFELCCWLGPVPGAVGLLLRGICWRKLFYRCGRGVQFGRGIVLRHPRRISLGDDVVIGEDCVLDARHEGVAVALVLGDRCMLSNCVIINCKGGTVDIGARTGIGAQTIIQSVNSSPVRMGEDVIVGPGCYVVGGASYNHDRHDIPINQQGIQTDSGCDVGENVWIGAKSTLLGGASVGSGSIVAAHALVKGVVDSNTIVAGVPARVIGSRD